MQFIFVEFRVTVDFTRCGVNHGHWHFFFGIEVKQTKVCFVVCDNGFSQIFYNCSYVEEIFSWHN